MIEEVTWNECDPVQDVLDAPVIVGRQTAGETVDPVAALEERLAHITTPITLSVIGCVVNGPGEARETDVGFTGGGNGTHQVYVAGVPDHRLKDADIVEHLAQLVEDKVKEIEAAKVAAEARPQAAQ